MLGGNTLAEKRRTGIYVHILLITDPALTLGQQIFLWNKKLQESP